jgi:hypothetical protein
MNAGVAKLILLDSVYSSAGPKAAHPRLEVRASKTIDDRATKWANRQFEIFATHNPALFCGAVLLCRTFSD